MNRSDISLSSDPVHGYVAYVVGQSHPSEAELIHHPWVQRLRYIHQLQTAWLVYPTAEHTRFPHVLGAMHLASVVTERLYPSLADVCDTVPSRGYVESLLRVAGLLHDVGHGPYGHFFDEHFLSHYELTHETVGAANQNFLFDSVHNTVRPLRDNQLFRHLPVSHRICRVYGRTDETTGEVARTLDGLIGAGGEDDLTNM